MARSSLVCVVDDDTPVRTLACRILESRGYAVRGYDSAEAFLAEFNDAEVACVVTDLKMPALDGGELLARLHAMGSVASVIVLTAHTDVRTAVRLMEQGALTVLEKPYKPAELADAVGRAVAQTQARRREPDELRAARERLANLTAEERAVLRCVVVGMPNKAIAQSIGREHANRGPPATCRASEKSSSRKLNSRSS